MTHYTLTQPFGTMRYQDFLGQQNECLLKYQAVLDENERLRIDNASLSQLTTSKQRTKCSECEQWQQKYNQLNSEYMILKQRFDELDYHYIEETKKDEDFENGPDRDMPRNRVRSGDRMGTTATSTTKRSAVKTRNTRGMGRGYE